MAEAHAPGEIDDLLARRDWSAIRARMAEMPVQDIADCLWDKAQPERMLLFRLLPRERSAEVFAYLSPEQQDALLRDLTNDETRHILTRLSPDDRTALLQELPAEVTQRLLSLLSAEDLREARGLLGYPPESVGRLMTPDYLAVQPDWTVARALKYIRDHAETGETANTVYVVDRRGKLLDAIDLRRFILASPRARVKSLMSGRAVSVSAFEDREAAVRAIQHYDLGAVPVVDSAGVLLGIVTVDDVMDVAEAEATEDFHKMASVATLHLSLRDARPSLLYRKRVGWLLVLVLMNVFSGAAIAYFEDAIEALVVLVFFLPLIIDSGGNAGAQSATLMVRALATGDVEIKDWFRLWGKEFAVSAALGATMGLAVSLLGLWRGGQSVALVVSLSMALVVIVGSLIGMLLPFVLARLRMDPAVASAPLITSIADIAGILVYFSVATAVLRLPVGA